MASMLSLPPLMTTCQSDVMLESSTSPSNNDVSPCVLEGDSASYDSYPFDEPDDNSKMAPDVTGGPAYSSEEEELSCSAASSTFPSPVHETPRGHEPFLRGKS